MAEGIGNNIIEEKRRNKNQNYFKTEKLIILIVIHQKKLKIQMQRGILYIFVKFPLINTTEMTKYTTKKEMYVLENNFSDILIAGNANNMKDSMV